MLFQYLGVNGGVHFQNHYEPGQLTSSLLSGQSAEPSHLRAKLTQFKSEHMNSVLSHPDSERVDHFYI